MTYWFAGQPMAGTDLTLTLDEPALLYGATVFTTLRVYHHTLDHPLTRWGDHLHRLRQSLATFQWPEPDWDRVRQGADWVGQSYPVLRITCLPDGREWVTGRDLPADLDRRQRQGIPAWLGVGEIYQRDLPGHKTGNYLASWLARQEAHRQGAQEAILVDARGHWLETSTGNLWGWADGHWWTPPLAAGVLPGVARHHLLADLAQRGLSVCHDPWTPAVVNRLEGVAYSNAVVQIVPIHTVITHHSRLEFRLPDRILQGLRVAFQPHEARILAEG